ncbi:MAG: hypothetical protein QM679_04930 [Patulibacter sp.]
MTAGIGQLSALRSVVVLLPDYRRVTAGVGNVLHLAADFARCDGLDTTLVVIGSVGAESARTDAECLLGAPAPFAVTAIADAQQLRSLRVDLAVATHWTTAEAALAVDALGTAYFYQDDERLFYPRGSEYHLAEATQRLGHFPLVGAPCLLDRFGARGHLVRPRLAASRPPDGHDDTARDGLLLYGRPTEPRNGFFLAASALRELAGRGQLPAVTAAGEQFSTRQLGVSDLMRCAGFRPRSELAALYAGHAIGLVPMLSAHPGVVPYELAACGVNVVVPRALENECPFGRPSPVISVEPRIEAIAAALEEAARRPPLPESERERIRAWFAGAPQDVPAFVDDVRAGRWAASHRDRSNAAPGRAGGTLAGGGRG